MLWTCSVMKIFDTDMKGILRFSRILLLKISTNFQNSKKNFVKKDKWTHEILQINEPTRPWNSRFLSQAIFCMSVTRTRIVTVAASQNITYLLPPWFPPFQPRFAFFHRMPRSSIIIDQLFTRSDVFENMTHPAALSSLTHWCHFQYVVFDVVHQRDHVMFHNLLHRDVIFNHLLVCLVHSFSQITNTKTNPQQLFFLLEEGSCCKINRNRFFSAISIEQVNSKTPQLPPFCIDLICDQRMYFFVCLFCFVKFSGG